MQTKDQFLMCSFILYFYVALKNHLFQNKSNKKLNRIVTPYLKFLQQRREIYCIFLHNVSNHIRQQSTEVIYTVVK